ncbi:MAG: GTPase domain-containing protein [Actinomycetia bacterium]|nr:GTPase domain-containing protein [Actinomycetes bacterium]
MTDGPGRDADQARQILATGFSDADSDIGRFNLAIFGMTGVGKSTLVNTIFGSKQAQTGIGEPVTRGSHLHRLPNGRMGIYDTEGLEIGQDGQDILARLREQIEENHSGPLADQIHVVWYCVRATDRRFTDMEAQFVTKLCHLGPPVLLVLTRATIVDGQWPPDVIELSTHIAALQMPTYGNPVYPVNAVADEWAGTPAHGLDQLLAATAAAAPLGVQRALAAAQRIDGQRKLDQAYAAVEAAATKLELRPVLRDVRATWAEMIASIAIIYGLPQNQAMAAALQSREVTSMHRLLYTTQAGVLLAPLRYGYLAAAKAGQAAAKSNTGQKASDWFKERRRRKDAAKRRSLRRGSPQQVAPTRSDKAPTGEATSPREMGSGLAAGTVTLAIGEAWIVVCERAYRASYPERPALDPAAFAAQFSAELSARMNAPLRAWGRLSTRRPSD